MSLDQTMDLLLKTQTQSLQIRREAAVRTKQFNNISHQPTKQNKTKHVVLAFIVFIVTTITHQLCKTVWKGPPPLFCRKLVYNHTRTPLFHFTSSPHLSLLSLSLGCVCVCVRSSFKAHHTHICLFFSFLIIIIISYVLIIFTVTDCVCVCVCCVLLRSSSSSLSQLLSCLTQQYSSSSSQIQLVHPTLM